MQIELVAQPDALARWFLANLFKLVATIRPHSDGFASEVFLIHRRDTLRATKIMAERALHHHPKDTVIPKTRPRC